MRAALGADGFLSSRSKLHCYQVAGEALQRKAPWVDMSTWSSPASPEEEHDFQ
jgi:hypothetical protein